MKVTPGVALQGQQVDAEGRVDRVDLAAAHRLNLGVRVRDDLEVDFLQLRLLAVPERVRLEGRPLAVRVVREDERAVRDRLAVVTADAVRPDLVEVEAGERLRRVDDAEDVLPRCIRLLPLERDLLRALVGVAGDLVVAVATHDVVLRVDERLPRVDEVLVRDGDLLAAPVPVGIGADRVRERRLRRLRARDEVEDVTELVVDVVRAADDRHDLDGRPELAATRERRVEADDVLLLAEDEDVLRLPGRRRARHLRPGLRERRSRRSRARTRACAMPDRGCRRRDDEHRERRTGDQRDAFRHLVSLRFFSAPTGAVR